jgi:hypothetical protein
LGNDIGGGLRGNGNTRQCSASERKNASAYSVHKDFTVFSDIRTKQSPSTGVTARAG